MRIRVTTRRAMTAVGLAAVMLAIPGELKNRRERRHYARIKVCYQDHAVMHQRYRSECLSSSGRRFYDSMDRENALSKLGYYDLPKCRNWDDEAAWHDRREKDLLESVTTYEQLERSARRRLIFPVIFDIRSSNQ
jgi:hypothetical protein